MTITNEPIIKAAKAAGLDVREKLHNGVMLPMFFRYEIKSARLAGVRRTFAALRAKNGVKHE